MTDFEVHIELDGETRLVGLAHGWNTRGSETVSFQYADSWLSRPDKFALEPALPLGRGVFTPPRGRALFGSSGTPRRTPGVAGSCSAPNAARRRRRGAASGP